MAVGNNIPMQGYESVLGIAKETTFGTFVTATTFLEFNSESLKYNLEEIKFEAINTYRDYTRRMTGNVTVDGSIEAPFNLAADACLWIFKSAMGGTVSSVLGSGTAYTHTFNAGNLENNKSSATASDLKSLSISIRPGESSMSTWDFYGCRVNSFSLKADIGGPVIMSASLVGKGASISSTIPAAVLTTINPVTFIGVQVCPGTTIGAATTTSQEYIKSFELTINNNLMSDHRVLGSREVAQLPGGRRDVMFKVGQVFDTLTAYNRYIQETITAWKIVIDSLVTLGVGMTTYSMVINLPKCYLQPFTPAVGGADAISQDLEYRCMYNSETAYAIQAQVINLTTNYD